MTRQEFVVHACIWQLSNLQSAVHQAAANIGFVEVKFVLFIEAADLDQAPTPECAVGALHVGKYGGKRVAVVAQGLLEVGDRVAQSIAPRIEILKPVSGVVVDYPSSTAHPRIRLETHN